MDGRTQRPVAGDARRSGGRARATRSGRGGAVSSGSGRRGRGLRRRAVADGERADRVRQLSSGVAYRAYVIEPDGTGRRQLTTGELNEECPRWSPDGERLALAAFRTTDGVVSGSWLQVVAADGELQWSTLAAPTRCPQWSPDGSRIAFVSGSALAVVDAEGGEPRRLGGRRRRAPRPRVVAGRRRARVRPDRPRRRALGSARDHGRRRRHGGEAARHGERRRSVPRGGGRRRPAATASAPARRSRGRRGTRSCSRSRSPRAEASSRWAPTGPPSGVSRRRESAPRSRSWSPDGSRIAFSGSGGRGDAQRGDDEIWVREPDGTGFVNVTDNLDSDYMPLWAPDGLQLAFLRTGQLEHRRPLRRGLERRRPAPARGRRVRDRPVLAAAFLERP